MWKSVNKGVKDEVNVKIDGGVDWGSKYWVVVKVGVILAWGVGKVVGD